jgi:hypothetical protein
MILTKLRQLMRSPAPGGESAPTGDAERRPLDGVMDTLDRLSALGYRPLFAWRRDTLIVLLASDRAPQFLRLSGEAFSAIAPRLADGEFTRLLVRRLRPDGRVGRLADHSDLLAQARAAPASLGDLATKLGPPPRASTPAGELMDEAYLAYLRTLRSSPDLIDFLYYGFVDVQAALKPDGPGRWPPFDDRTLLPPTVPAQPRRKSALLLNNAYYHYEHLAAGLRRRGWEVLTVSLESPDSPNQQFYHGEDLNLFNADAQIMRDQTQAFFASAPERFSAMHFYTNGKPSFFADNCDKLTPSLERVIALPWDFMEMRRHRMVIGYMAAGSMDGARQSSIRKLSRGLCGHCSWEDRPDVCNDIDNMRWAQRLEAMCDWIGLENDWATPERIGRQYVRYPVITAMDPEAWRPDLEPREDMRLERSPGEILVYHAVGNYLARRVGTRDLKGTGAVMAAIDRLKAEGFAVRLVFATDVPSRVVRHLQVQADIVIDQLNYGRMGANARESLMLGKPVIVKMDPRQSPPLDDLAYIAEAPVANADESTVYEVLKALIQDPERRAELGAAARQFALKWHSADACAERFEDIVERVRAGLPPENPVVAAPSAFPAAAQRPSLSVQA